MMIFYSNVGFDTDSRRKAACRVVVPCNWTGVGEALSTERCCEIDRAPNFRGIHGSNPRVPRGGTVGTFSNNFLEQQVM